MEYDKDPKNYELAVLVKSEDLLPGVAAFLGQHQATVSGTPRVKRIVLAYPIKKEREAIFASYLFSATPRDAKQLEKDLAMRSELLRSMIIVAPVATETSVPVGEGMAMRHRPLRPVRVGNASDLKPAATLSNEALEKKIEEILK